MSAAQRNLREHLRAASEALPRIAAELAAEGEGGGISAATVDDAQLKRALLQAARKNLAAAARAALHAPEPAGLPGLGGAVDASEAQDISRADLSAVWSSIAELEWLCGNRDASIAAYGRTLEIAPDHLAANAQLAELLENRHDLPAAKAHAERALSADPNNVVAGIALARIFLRERNFSEAERTARAVTNAPSEKDDERALAWTLVGEARERLDQIAAAFKAFTQANMLMLQRYRGMQEAPHPANPRSVRGLTQFVLNMDASTWRTAAKFQSPAPAFLIGFPRSGTTLLEQILSSHSKITCLEEKEYLVEAMSVVLKDGDSLDRVAALSASEIETVREAYWRIVPAHRPSDGRIVVDKHPLHIVLLPLINRIFPDAKIILALRDPRDVALSCYQQCFGMNVATAQFLELRRTAEYYDAVMELMVACREKLRLDVLEVDYRVVVAELEERARALAEFLALPFEAAMLRYDETARGRTITSASARQVISPIYTRSVDRWRRYAHELAPILPLLNNWARRLGYNP